MELSLHFISNVILFVVCLSMGTVFISIPDPKLNGLKNYQISLKVLASAYFIFAVLTFAVLFFKLNDNARELFTYTSITISAFQAFLFTNALLTLINPKFVTKRYLLIQLTPFVIITILFAISLAKFGNPVIANLNEIGMYLTNPTILIRLLYFALYITQLVLYTLIYFNQEKKYRTRVANSLSIDYWLKLSWVRIAFISALTVGTIVMVSYFLPRKWDWAFTTLYALFYFGFALEYIKYHKIYNEILPSITPPIPENASKEAPVRKNINWNSLKEDIINNAYYLESGITIEELATRLKVGRTTLSNFINKEEGVNYNKWINTLRINKAKELLINKPTESLSTISEMVGYSEQANFSRQFRLITGYAPTLWRQKQEGNL